MTDPGLVATNADAMLGMLKRRKKLHEFMMGAVQQTITLSPGVPNTIPVILDGDTQPVGAQSLIGSVTLDQRVPVLFVPPAGYYIIGRSSDPGFVHTQAGQALFTFTSQTSASVAVVFTTPFTNTPAITATIGSTAGVTNLWFVRVGLASNAGFTIVVSASLSNTWSAVPVYWSASEMTQ